MYSTLAEESKSLSGLSKTLITLSISTVTASLVVYGLFLLNKKLFGIEYAAQLALQLHVPIAVAMVVCAAVLVVVGMLLMPKNRDKEMQKAIMKLKSEVIKLYDKHATTVSYFNEMNEIARKSQDTSQKSLEVAEKIVGKKIQEQKPDDLPSKPVQSKHTGGFDFRKTSDKKLNDVIVAPDVKEALFDVCNDASESYRENLKILKCKTPTGYLFHGPPGTGKTLLAQAIAGEADASFVSVSGSELCGMYLGEGTRTIKSLFDTAKENSPCIIFIDEIDSVGKKRRSANSSGGKDQNQTLNQLLVEMGNIKPEHKILIIAATNRLDDLDPALIRPGRFDKKIHIPLPNQATREKILQLYMKNVPGESKLGFKELAKRTKGYSGADLVELVNEAKRDAAKRAEVREELTVTVNDFEYAIEKNKIKGGAREPDLLNSLSAFLKNPQTTDNSRNNVIH